MAKILKAMGITEHEPRVILQLLEFSQREHAQPLFYGSINVPLIAAGKATRALGLPRLWPVLGNALQQISTHNDFNICAPP